MGGLYCQEIKSRARHGSAPPAAPPLLPNRADRAAPPNPHRLFLASLQGASRSRPSSSCSSSRPCQAASLRTLPTAPSAALAQLSLYGGCSRPLLHLDKGGRPHGRPLYAPQLALQRLHPLKKKRCLLRDRRPLQGLEGRVSRWARLGWALSAPFALVLAEGQTASDRFCTRGWAAVRPPSLLLSGQPNSAPISLLGSGGCAMGLRPLLLHRLLKASPQPLLRPLLPFRLHTSLPYPAPQEVCRPALIQHESLSSYIMRGMYRAIMFIIFYFF
ncbi:hypothetical protein L7F22_030771 [Adiantum nelumboides]|nr:hypothetical protein [Adiantum nelumboides]